MSTAVAERRENPVAVIRQNLDAMAPELVKALPAHVTVERFTRVAMTAIQQQPALINSERAALFGAIVRLAQDGLLPDGREAAIVMFGSKAQAMPMIAGILKKVRQSGEVAKLSAQVVHEHDAFEVRYGFDEDVHHVPPPLDRPRGKAIGAYATAVLKDGSRLLEVMSLEEIEKVRKVSRAGQSGPWKEWWGEMARKTVLRRLSKRLPMSSDLMDAFDRDETMATTIDLPANDRTVTPQLSRLDALENHINGAADEGPSDDQRGETPDIAAALEAIRAAQTEADVHAAYDSIVNQASDEDAEALILAKNTRIAEIVE
ncbi:RecT Recombinational DNA repair protein (RecE pathway) [uncultured Caudovirales phage]|uniref:RecT Recombinational DNA repair protein (RecE pathway) n=1 Tax=uncultured Caudovirales phage TaxID=2100421 RepID=A0A6J5M0D1_9CAUD|nr:RecT Recombinational DNA repair protein (RecE pathway) [uncultured Caudovirales phage]